MKADYNESRLSLLPGLITIVAAIVVIALTFFVLNFFNERRQEEVYNKYSTETEAYIVQNRAGLIDLFTNYFVSKPCSNGPYATNPKLPPCPKLDDHTIAQHVKTNLKDWSSTAFLVKEKNNKVSLVTLNGNKEDYYIYPQSTSQDVDNLLGGSIKTIPWEDYYYAFPGKEVVIPIKDDSGTIIGAIIRGVVEK